MKQRIKVEFDPLLETGEAAIDAQHRELFVRLDRLLEASHEGRSAAEIDGLLQFLGRYIVEHFGAEERLMTEAGYPDIESHRREHEWFVQEYGIMYREFKQEGPRLAFVIRVSNRVATWFREHIFKTDRVMAAWIREHRQ